MALTQTELNRGSCSTPGCDHTRHDPTLYLHGKCHPHAAVTAMYSKATGTITIRCTRCEALVAEVKVAQE